MAEVIVRKPYSTDMEAVYKLRHEVLGEPIERSRKIEEASAKATAIGEVVHVAGFDNGDLIATGRISEDLYRVWTLRYLGVREGLRGEGIGTEMLTYLEHAAAQKGATAIEVKARQEEPGQVEVEGMGIEVPRRGSVDFYRKMGYVPTSIAYVRFEIPHLLMIKELRR